MQIMAKSDDALDLAEEHERLVLEAFADGIVTPTEQARIIRSARRLRLANDYQAKRTRLVCRMLRGGHMHRSLTLDIRDYDELVAQEDAATFAYNVAANVAA